jgi:hypothetical protein
MITKKVPKSKFHFDNQERYNLTNQEQNCDGTNNIKRMRRSSNMKEFKEVVKMKIIPTTFVLRCTLCGFEITGYDRHLGLIKMNEHLVSKHSKEVNPLGREDLYSRKPEIMLDKF